MHNRAGHQHRKGFLSFLILWLLSRKNMTGVEITEELEKRKGNRPSPGTIYPVLKNLKEKGLIIDDASKSYKLTKKGEEELDLRLERFFTTFCDIDEMRSHCRCHGMDCDTK